MGMGVAMPSLFSYLLFLGLIAVLCIWGVGTVRAVVYPNRVKAGRVVARRRGSLQAAMPTLAGRSGRAGGLRRPRRLRADFVTLVAFGMASGTGCQLGSPSILGYAVS